MKKQQSGFTLIELVVVIVILGILAATAIPKFEDLSGEAKLAACDGAKGAIVSAAVIQLGKNSGVAVSKLSVSQAVILNGGISATPGAGPGVIEISGTSVSDNCETDNLLALGLTSD